MDLAQEEQLPVEASGEESSEEWDPSQLRAAENDLLNDEFYELQLAKAASQSAEKIAKTASRAEAMRKGDTLKFFFYKQISITNRISILLRKYFYL